MSSLKTSVGSLEEKQVSVTGGIGDCAGKADAALAAAQAAGDAAKTAAAAAAAATALSQGKEVTVEAPAPAVDWEEIRRIAKEEVSLCSKSRSR